jgi:hypothetical protein
MIHLASYVTLPVGLELSMLFIVLQSWLRVGYRETVMMFSVEALIYVCAHDHIMMSVALSSPQMRFYRAVYPAVAQLVPFHPGRCTFHCLEKMPAHHRQCDLRKYTGIELKLLNLSTLRYCLTIRWQLAFITVSSLWNLGTFETALSPVRGWLNIIRGLLSWWIGQDSEITILCGQVFRTNFSLILAPFSSGRHIIMRLIVPKPQIFWWSDRSRERMTNLQM